MASTITKPTTFVWMTVVLNLRKSGTLSSDLDEDLLGGVCNVLVVDSSIAAGIRGSQFRTLVRHQQMDAVLISEWNFTPTCSNHQ